MPIRITHLTHFAGHVAQDAPDNRQRSKHKDRHHDSHQSVSGALQDLNLGHLDERQSAEDNGDHREQNHRVQCVQQVRTPRPANTLRNEESQCDQSQVHGAGVRIPRVQHTGQSQQQVTEQEHRTPIPEFWSETEEDEPICLDRHQTALRSSRDHNAGCDVKSTKPEQIHDHAEDTENKERGMVTAAAKDVGVLRKRRRTIRARVALQRQDTGHGDGDVKCLEHLPHRIAHLGPDHHQALLHYTSSASSLRG
mmetsp:Transcript_41997/g.100976  ORF Transcript_41997/g.100976 Transcript_41997/m.100976 type:complete len:252 (-) Transcript_41997:3485-4240(-)